MFSLTRRLNLLLYISRPELLHFTLKTQYCPLCIARLRSLAAIFLMLKNRKVSVRKLLQFTLKKLLHFASEVVTFRVNVTFCVKSCYISRCYILRLNTLISVITFHIPTTVKNSWVYLFQFTSILNTVVFLHDHFPHLL